MANRIRVTPEAIEKVREKARKASKTLFAFDCTMPGFGLRATSKGTVAFIAQSRKLGRTTIGVTDALSIEEARAKAIALLNKAPTQPQNLKTLIPAFIEDVKDGTRYRQEQAHLLQQHIMPSLGAARLVHNLTAREIETYIDKQRRGAQFGHFMHVKTFLTWCKRKGAISENVLRDVEAPKQSSPRDRRLYENEVKALWWATRDKSCPYQMAFRVALLTGLRLRSEIASLRWSDIEERKDGLWCNIPGSRTKNRRAHSFFVTPAVQECFDAMRERNKAMGWQDSPFIFATFIGTKAIGEPNVGNWSRKARQLSEHMVDYLNDPLEHFRIHDLRRTVGWFMADEDVRDEVIDTVLGHTQGKIRRTYLTNSLDKQTKVALLTWNDRLDRIVNCGYAKS